MSTTPYPYGAQHVAWVFLGVFGAISVGVWRGVIYDFTPREWALAVAAGVLGAVWTAAVTRGRLHPYQRTLLFAALAAAFLLEVFRRRLGLPPEVATALWLFGGGATLAFGARVTGEVVARRRGVKRWLAETDSLRDPGVNAVLRDYFAATGRVEGQLDPFRKAVSRSFRRLSRRPGLSWQAAASALRSFVAALDTHLEAMRLVPYPECLEEHARENAEATAAVRSECLRLARSLESGERPDLTRFNEANARAVEAARAWQYAVGMLAAHHRVSVPRWFLKRNCELAKAA